MSAFTQMMNKEEKKRIPQMDMDEVKNLLCPLHGQDPIYCISCKGIKGCPAGQRAVYLLDQMTGRADIPKKQKTEFPKDSPEALEFATKLAAMEDPITWLCEQGASYHTAVERIRRYKSRYPDLMANVQIAGRGTSNMMQTPGRLKAAFESGDPIRWLLVNYHIPKIRGEEIIEKALKMYPELKNCNPEKPEPAKEEPKEDKPMKDEISLADFISELQPVVIHSQEAAEKPGKFAQEAASDAELDKMPTSTEEPPKTANLPDKMPNGEKPDTIAELNTKYNQLNKREEEIREQIRQLEVDLKWIEKSKEAIALVTSLFDQNTAIGKSLITE